MRLGSLLSKPSKKEFQEVEHFLLKKRGHMGQQVKLNVGYVMLNYYCKNCDDLRTFTSKGNLSSIFVNKKIISIDCVLACNCEANVQIWFLLEAENDMCDVSPRVRIIKRSERFSKSVQVNENKYGEYTELLNKATKAYRENLGAGAIVYLRKAFEKITVDTAKMAGIEFIAHKGGNPKNFSDLLKKVDEKCSIIPKEFSADGYRLFKELSNVVHGEYDEELGLKKFEPLKSLVIGVIENVERQKKNRDATVELGWQKSEV